MQLNDLLNATRVNTSNTNKQRSELVGTRQAFTGQVTVQPQEEMSAFETFIQAMTDAFAPETIVERQLAQSYATFQWRINRAAAIEENLFTLGNMEEIAENLNVEHPQLHNAATNAKTFRERADTFIKMSVYTQRLVHQSEIVLKRLLQLQADRKQRDETELNEAARLYQLHTMHEAAFDPRKHGLQLTVVDIQSFIHQRHLSDQALKAECLHFNRKAFAEQGGRFAA